MVYRHTRRIKKQKGGHLIDIDRTAEIIYNYLDSRKDRYNAFKTENSVKKAIENIMGNDDYDFIHRPGKMWDKSYSYEEFLNLFLLFERFRLKELGDFLTKGEAKIILETDFNLYEDETVPQQRENALKTYKEMMLIKELGNARGLPRNMNSELGHHVSGYKGSFNSQLAQLNTKMQKLGISLASKYENTRTKGLTLRRKSPPKNSE
jgi:hypothetical protein